MTIFSGAISLRPTDTLPASLIAGLRASVSRNSTDEPAEASDQGFFVTKVDIGAFGAHGFERGDDGSVTIVAGEPLMADGEGDVEWNRARDLALLHPLLATRDTSGLPVPDSLLLCYRGVNQTTPIGDNQSAGLAGSNTTVNIPAMTLVAPGANRLIGFHSIRANSVVADVPNMTARRKVSETATFGNIAGADNPNVVSINPGITAVTHGSAILHAAAHIELRAA